MALRNKRIEHFTPFEPSGYAMQGTFEDFFRKSAQNDLRAFVDDVISGYSLNTAYNFDADNALRYTTREADAYRSIQAYSLGSMLFDLLYFGEIRWFDDQVLKLVTRRANTEGAYIIRQENAKYLDLLRLPYYILYSLYCQLDKQFSTAKIVFKKSGFNALFQGKGKQDIDAVRNHLDEELSGLFGKSGTVVMVDKEDSVESSISLSFSNFAEAKQFAYDMISHTTRIPLSKLFGQAPSGFNSTGEGDRENYLQLLKTTRASYLTPILEDLKEKGILKGYSAPAETNIYTNLLTPQDLSTLLLDNIISQDTAGRYLEQFYGVKYEAIPIRATGEASQPIDAENVN